MPLLNVKIKRQRVFILFFMEATSFLLLLVRSKFGGYIHMCLSPAGLEPVVGQCVGVKACKIEMS